MVDKLGVDQTAFDELGPDGGEGGREEENVCVQE